MRALIAFLFGTPAHSLAHVDRAPWQAEEDSQ